MIAIALWLASSVPGMIWEHKGIGISEVVDLVVLRYYSTLDIYHQNLPAFLLVRCAKVEIAKWYLILAISRWPCF